MSIELCPICNKEFKYLKLHLNKKHGIKSEPIDMSNDNEYVSCVICGFRRKNIAYHINKVHNMNVWEYREKYNSPTCSKAYRESQSNAAKSGNRLQNIINRNKSDKQRSIVSERNKDPEFIKKCKEGIKNSETWHDAHSEGAHKRNLRMWQDPEYAKKMKQHLSDRFNNPEYMKKMSELSPSRYGKKHKYYSEVFNKEFSLKSTSELNFLKLCEDHNDDWNITDIKYEEFPIKYMKDDIEHSYYPDFFIYINNELKFIIEVKYDEGSDRDINNNKFKSSCAIKYCKDNDMTYCWFKSRYNSDINNLNKISLMPK